MKNKWLSVFFIFAATNLLAVLTQQKMLIWCTKPALMPLLAIWLFTSGAGIPVRLRNGWLLGLASFLLAHVSYIVAVNTGLREHRGFLLKNPVWIPVLMLYPLKLLSWLWPGISADMGIPVTVYALVITTMA
ncbi:MAG: lysoplasmalogenase family protein, partial [Bacteroidota bacterium]